MTDVFPCCADRAALAAVPMCSPPAMSRATRPPDARRASPVVPPRMPAAGGAAILLSLLLLACGAAFAQGGGQVGGGAGRTGGDRVVRGEPESVAEETFQARWQATWVWQSKRRFSAAYSGPNSLSPQRERSYSVTASLMLGWRPWTGTELYVDPEMALGDPLSQLTGLGGFPNGELARTAGTDPTFYVSRWFARHTFSFGGDPVTVESDQNQLGGTVSARRLVLTAGAMSVIDLFDDNTFSHDARTQFMNWSLVTHGAYDFAADARGYSRGVTIEWFDGPWALRVGRFAMPTESNGTRLQRSLGRSHGDQLEIERGWRIDGEPGRARLLLFRNRADMGSYAQALELAAASGGTPDLSKVRRDRSKTGFGINLEQRLAHSAGVFLRASRNDGASETFAYTEIDRSISVGAEFDGSLWGRADDTFGIAFARNGLSPSHRNYLAAGGLGFFIGDGRLDYSDERVFETFYAMAVAPRAWFSGNFQYIANPAYNAARGPVRIFGVRLHTNF